MVEGEEAELTEPQPDIHELFTHYNDLYFQGHLGACTVEWSRSRVALCAGECKCNSDGGCEIKLLERLLKGQPASHLKNILLHEMIRAYVFITSGSENHNAHGDSFQQLVIQINGCTTPDPQVQRPADGYKISSIKDEVDSWYKHQWMCGQCGDLVKRVRNYPPSSADCKRGRAAISAGQSCAGPNCHWHTHAVTCGGDYIKCAEPEGYVDRRKPRRKNSDIGDKELLQTSGSVPTTVGKKRPSIVASGGTPKKGTGSSISDSAREVVSPEKLSVRDQVSDSKRSTLDDKCPDKQSLEVECNVRKGEDSVKAHGALAMMGSSCVERKRVLRQRKQETDTPTSEPVALPQANDVSWRKRRRSEGSTRGAKKAREPVVILAWKGWCTFADQEDDEGIEALNNKRDERRKLERQMLLTKRTEEQADAGFESHVGRSQVLAVAEQQADPSDSPDQGEEIMAVEVSEGTTTSPEEVTTSNQSPCHPHHTSTCMVANAHGEKSLKRTASGSLAHRDPIILVDYPDDEEDEILGVESKQVVATVEGKIDPSDPSVQDEDIPTNLEEGARTSNALTALSNGTNICTVVKVKVEEDKKDVCKRTVSCFQGHADAIIIVDDDEDGREGWRPATVRAKATSVNDRVATTGGGLSNLVDNPNQLHSSLPKFDGSGKESSQLSGPTQPPIFGDQVCNEQVGDPNNFAMRSNQKVIDLSDEKEEGDLETPDQLAILGPHDYSVQKSSNGGQQMIESSSCKKEISVHLLQVSVQHDCPLHEGEAINERDGGAGTTSGSETSSIDPAGSFGSVISQWPAAGDMPPMDDGKAKGRMNERTEPVKGSLGPGEALICRRRGEQQEKTSVGKSDSRRAHFDTHEGRRGRGGSIKATCCICLSVIPADTSNAEVNSHIDQCLEVFSRSR